MSIIEVNEIQAKGLKNVTLDDYHKLTLMLKEADDEDDDELVDKIKGMMLIYRTYAGTRMTINHGSMKATFEQSAQVPKLPDDEE